MNVWHWQQRRIISFFCVAPSQKNLLNSSDTGIGGASTSSDMVPAFPEPAFRVTTR
jgi:hypothetical protein